MSSWMDFLGPLISGGTSLLAGSLGSKAATGAAQTQSVAAQQAAQLLSQQEQQALALQNQAYQQGLTFQSPYAQSGYAANRMLSELLGITPSAPTTYGNIGGVGTGIGSGGGGGGLPATGINLAAPGLQQGSTASKSTGQTVLGDVMGGAGMGASLAALLGTNIGGSSLAGALGLGGLAGPIGLGVGALAEGIPALINLASGPDSYQAGSKEAQRDFGVNVSDDQMKTLFGDLGFNESQAWPIRKDLESSPQALAALGQIAQNQGTMPQFLNDIGNIQTSWGTQDFDEAYKYGMSTGDWSALNSAYNQGFAPSQALQSANPNWQQALDIQGTNAGAIAGLPDTLSTADQRLAALKSGALAQGTNGQWTYTDPTTGKAVPIQAQAAANVGLGSNGGDAGAGVAGIPGSGGVVNPYTGVQSDVPQSMLGSLLNLSGYTAPSLPDIGGFKAPTQADVMAQMDPSLQFQLKQGRDAIQASAAAQGTLMSGGTAKALEQYAQGLGSTYYQQAYQNANQNAMNEYTTGTQAQEYLYGQSSQNALNQYNSQVQAKQNLYNQLMGLSGSGQGAANQMTGISGQYGTNVGNTMMNTAGNIGNLWTSGAAAQAGGQVGSANSWRNALNNIGNTVSGTLTNLRTGLNQGGYGGGVTPPEQFDPYGAVPGYND